MYVCMYTQKYIYTVTVIYTSSNRAHRFAHILLFILVSFFMISESTLSRKNQGKIMTHSRPYTGQ